MAKFEIPQSTAQVEKGRATNITALTINPNLARQLGSDISQAGAAFDKVKADQRLIEDQNRFYEIIEPVQKNIEKSLLESSKFESLDLAESEHEKAYDIDVSNENKTVQKLVTQHLFKEKLSNRSKLYKAVLARAAERTNLNDQTFLKNNLIQRISPIDSDRAKGDNEFNNWFSNPLNQVKRSPEEHQKLLNEWELLKRQIIINTGAKRDSYGTLLNAEEIKKEFGNVYGEIILKKAENAFISGTEQEIIENNQEINERVFNQATVFTGFANKIIDNEEPITIGEIHDAFDAGDINSAQYEALVDIYADPDKPSDQELINIINNQIVIAEGVNEFDDIQNNINSAQDILKNTNIKDVSILNKLIGQLKVDPKKNEDYKDFYKILQINMGDIGGFADVLTGGGGLTEEDKLKTQDALNRYNNYVSQGQSPEEAYLRVISTVTKDVVPDIYSANFQPLNLKIENIGEAIKKDPDNFFEKQGNLLAQKLKKGEIDKMAFMEDVSRLDLMKEVLNLRLKIFDNIDQATAKKEKASANMSDVLNQILKSREGKN